MKIVFLLMSIVLACELKAQGVAELLFRKGTEMEYTTYGAKPSLGKEKIVEFTRITLIVTDVKDSNNVTYSYITKKGQAANDTSIGYTKKFVLTRSHDEVSIPQDLYIIDTAYLIDIGVKGRMGKRPYATTRFKTKVFVLISGSLDKGKIDFLPKTYDVDGTALYDNMDKTSPMFGVPATQKWSLQATLKSFTVGPKIRMRVTAGIFSCYKITSIVQMTTMGRTTEVTSVAYYSDEIGFLKTEAAEGKENGSVELVRLKKGNASAPVQ